MRYNHALQPKVRLEKVRLDMVMIANSARQNPGPISPETLSRSRPWRRLPAVGLTILLLAPLNFTWAKVYQVKEMLYRNKGAYTNCLKIKAIGVRNKYRTEILSIDKKCVQAGELAHFHFKNYDKIEEGKEVWLSYQITSGDGGTCRKENTRFAYHPNGGIAMFKSAGTTTYNNRCKIVCKQCRS